MPRLSRRAKGVKGPRPEARGAAECRKGGMSHMFCARLHTTPRAVSLRGLRCVFSQLSWRWLSRFPGVRLKAFPLLDPLRARPEVEFGQASEPAHRAQDPRETPAVPAGRSVETPKPGSRAGAGGAPKRARAASHGTGTG